MVATDLFVKKTMRQRVKEFCQDKGFVTSIDLENLKDKIRHTEGNVKGLLRIHREARQLAEDGLLRRLDKKEKLFRGFKNSEIAVYEWVGKKPMRWTNLPVTPIGNYLR